jgi:GT2 family glycosyltransferase
MPVDVVVVAYNSSRDLGACLDGVAASGDAVGRVVVVDNASQDDSSTLAQEHPSRPTVVRSATNLGFGGGCNLGFAATEAPLVLFLNPDAVPEPGAIALLGEVVGRDVRLGAVGARLVDPRGETTAAAAGSEPGLRSAAGHFLLLSRLPLVGRWFPPLQLSDAAQPARVDWVSGGAMVVRREAFSAVGGFDERYFLYMEDVDLCRRLREAGWRVAYEPGAAVRHAIGGSQPEDQPSRWYRAFHRYIVERRGGIAARVTAAMAAVGMALRWLAYRRGRPTQARRMRAAAQTAVGLALGRSSRERAA